MRKKHLFYLIIFSYISWCLLPEHKEKNTQNETFNSNKSELNTPSNLSVDKTLNSHIKIFKTPSNPKKKHLIEPEEDYLMDTLPEPIDTSYIDEQNQDTGIYLDANNILFIDSDIEDYQDTGVFMDPDGIGRTSNNIDVYQDTGEILDVDNPQHLKILVDSIIQYQNTGIFMNPNEG